MLFFVVNFEKHKQPKSLFLHSNSQKTRMCIKQPCITCLDISLFIIFVCKIFGSTCNGICQKEDEQRGLSVMRFIFNNNNNKYVLTL